MAWGQEKGADVKISALRACQYEIFDFVPCSLPLKTLILLTFSCFLIRRRGKHGAFLFVVLQHSIQRMCLKKEYRFFGPCAGIYDDENYILKK